ncbi:MAG: cytochrome c biogenesis protein [Planctomycetota bacterium]
MLLLVLVATIVSPFVAAHEHTVERKDAWPAHVVALAESLPIQDGGRVKPFSTFADFTLLRWSGKRSLRNDGAQSTPATEFLLDLVFFPAQAAQREVFLVQNAEVIEAIGLSIDGKKKRDRYSFAELEPALPRLMELAHQYDGVEPKSRTAVQAQLVHLGENVLSFLRISRHETLAIVPPDVGHDEWHTPAELAGATSLSESEQRALRSFDALVATNGDMAVFERDVSTFHAAVVDLATRRGEYAKIELERTYYKADLLTWSLALFVLGFVSMSVLWMRPQNRLLYSSTWLLTLAGTLGLAAAITLRCWIRARPPVSTLYETVLFVTLAGCAIALVTEWIDRKRIAISACAILGMIGVFIANGYETLDKQDTMPSLVAVLDTNFWLATHVTAITIGYSAGMLAALLGSLYLLTKLVGWKKRDPSFHRALGRMVYGVVCFGVIFATVGTILGGIWANDSWGRFWGWDPKENGALLIVISQIVMLHARMGGYVRDHGLCMAAAFGGTIVAFSWWGVNLLGVGLHSYGFTSGIHTTLWTYYALQWGVVVAGAVVWLRERKAMRRRTNAGDAASESDSVRRSAAA